MSGARIAVWLPELEELAGQPDALREHTPGLLRALTAGASAQPPDWLPALQQANAPSAAFARQHDNGDAGQHCWARADAVVMQPDISRVHLLAVERHGLTPAQADQLLADLQPLFADQGWELSRGQTENAHERWYVQTDGDLPPAFPPPDSALGHPLEKILRGAGRSPGTAVWQRLQSETQMLLHQHPVNQQRQSDGLPALTSLWFWGAGRLPAQLPSATPDKTLAMSVELAGWCRWADAEVNWSAGHVEQRQALSTLAESSGRLLVEWRIERGISLSQNLSNLEHLIGDLLKRAAKTTMHLYQHPQKNQLLARPGWRQRWLMSGQSIEKQALRTLRGLVE